MNCGGRGRRLFFRRSRHGSTPPSARHSRGARIAVRSTIARHLSIDGELSSDDDLTIQGCVTGVVIVRGATLIIEAAARLEADVRAARVVVHGEVQGAISA